MLPANCCDLRIRPSAGPGCRERSRVPRLRPAGSIPCAWRNASALWRSGLLLVFAMGLRPSRVQGIQTPPAASTRIPAKAGPSCGASAPPAFGGV